MQEDAPPPEPARPLDVRDIGAVRAALNQIRERGFQGAIEDAEIEKEQANEAEEGEDSTPDVTDTPYLRELDDVQAARARHARRWRPMLIAALKMVPFPTFAARAVRVDRKTVALHRQRDPIFDQACLDAEAEGAAMLQASAWASAVDGDMVPVFHQGVIVGHTRKYSDSMRAMLLKGLFPATFDRTPKMNVSVKGATSEPDALDLARAHEVVSTLSPLMMARQVAMIQGKAPPALPNDGGFITLEDAAAVTEPVPDTQPTE